MPHARSRRRAIRNVALDDGNTQTRSREFPCAGTAYDPGPDNDDVIDHCFKENSRHTYVKYSETDAGSKRVGEVEVQR